MPDVDDDDLLNFPVLGDADDAPSEVELGLDELLDVGAEEHLDLDDSVGVEDDAQLFSLEIPTGSETPGTDDDGFDAIPIEGLDEGDEYGWADTGDDEGEGGVDLAELELPALTPLGGEDGGEEGVEDAIELGFEGDDGVPHLPPISRDIDADGGDDELSLGEDVVLDARFAEGAEPSASGPTILYLGPNDDDIRCISRPPRLAGGTGLYTIGPRCAAVGLAHHSIVSVDVDDQLVLVGTAFDGLLRSEDGEVFAPVDGWPAGGAWVVREAMTRLRWARTESGALYRSDDEGRSWSGPLMLKPVVAMSTPPGGGVVVLCAGRETPLQVARSTDGGAQWAAVAGPEGLVSGEASEWSFAAHGDSLALASDDESARLHVSGDRGRHWIVLDEVGASALCIVDEGGELVLYAATGGVGSCTILRYRRGKPTPVMDVGAQALARGIEPRGDGDGEARVHAIVASQASGVTVLWVATGIGLFRVEVEWDDDSEGGG